MAKVKVIKNNLDQNLNGTYFNDSPSQTIFSFGRFNVTSNFDGKVSTDYSSTLSTFVRPVTLETMNVSNIQSEILYTQTTNAVLNLDKSDLNTFVRFGSAYEFLRVSIQNIILKFPGSLFANSQSKVGGNITYSGYSYNIVTNKSTFYVPTTAMTNTFGMVINVDNTSLPDNNVLKNLNMSFDKFVIWSELEPDKPFQIIGYTGNTVNHSNKFKRIHVRFEVIGNPFEKMLGDDIGSLDFHIKPNNLIFEEYRGCLSDYEKNIISERDGFNGFKFVLKDPTLLDNGSIIYSDALMLWNTGDKYNIDIDTPNYQKFLKIVLTIGAKYDKIKTDLIARFLTPASLKAYDFTEEGKMTKLLRIYGREFDQIRQFIDSLVYINKVTYDKSNNIPDQLVRNMAKTFGWNYFSLVNEDELVSSFLTIDENERNLNEDLLPAEIDVELWRRILNNTNYFWESKGTREAIKSMFLLIGIPEPFINITEYVYTVDGKIDPRTVTLSQQDFPSNSLPYDSEGYPVAPLETKDFYFQTSGDTDSGQAYLDVFRMAGFTIRQTVDNKKSWVQTGATTRKHYSTPQYYQEDNKLIINTKELDVALDTARGIEFDVFDYIKNTDFPANSSGYTMPYSFVNISLGVTGTQNTFALPAKTQGDFEVRYNGILLDAPKTGTTTGVTVGNDYTIDYINNTFTINHDAINSGNRRDVIQASYIYSGGTAVSGITVQYVVTRVKPNITGTIIPLPTIPRGDVQVTINGIAMTKGTAQFNADYILDPNNANQIIIQNQDVIAYLVGNPEVQVAYVEVTGSNDINVRSEVVRIDNFNNSKIYFNASANKYVYKLNYKANKASDIKFLVDGIALEPNKDYSINVMNPYEVFLPKGLRYGTVLSVYYLVGGNAVFTPVVSDTFGVGDISKLSFLEFLELIQRRMINARNRKTISDFKGGWYPTLLRVYLEYLKRANLPENDPLKSNGYTFQNLYPFLSKYNAFFQRFTDQLLSATVIMKNGGLLVRNSAFTKQKFMYKRGVNVDSAAGYNNQGRIFRDNVRYLGDAGSTFFIKQASLIPIPPSATAPIVETTMSSSIEQTLAYLRGYVASDGGSPILERGIAYDTTINPTINDNKWVVGPYGSLGYIGNYGDIITGLVPNTTYYFRAYAINNVDISYGEDMSFTTTQVVIVPTVTTLGSGAIQTTNAINGVGGTNINVPSQVEYYGMNYRVVGGSTWETLQFVGALSSNSFNANITGLIPSTNYEYRAYIMVAGVFYYGETLTRATIALPQYAPTVTTATLTDITETTATAGGNVTSDGNSTVTERGVVYAFTQNPTTSNNKVASGSGTGSFTTSLTGLSPDTSYFVRAYAINGVGTSYGNQVTLTTNATPSIPVTVSINETYNYGDNACGYITVNPPLTDGQCFTISINYNQTDMNLGTYGDVQRIQICCKPNGAQYYQDISTVIDPAYSMMTDSVRYCGYGGGQVTLCCGDSLSWCNQAMGMMDSCSTFCIHMYSSTPNIHIEIGDCWCQSVSIM